MPKNTFIPKGLSELDKYLKMTNPTTLPSFILNNKALQQVAKVNPQKNEGETHIRSQHIVSLLGEIEKYNKLISSKSNAMDELLNNIEKTEKTVKKYTFDEALTKTRSEYAFIIKALEDK